MIYRGLQRCFAGAILATRPARFATMLRALACVLALAGPASAAQAFELLSIETKHDDNEYLLRIEARFAASPAQLLAVLTDYEHIHELHPRMVESRSLGQVGPATEEVATRFEGCVMMFCQTVRRVEQIRVEEHALLARDVPQRGSFREGTTTWRFDELEDGAKLRYESRFVPAFSVTPVVGPLVMMRSLREMTVETMREVDRRAVQLDD